MTQPTYFNAKYSLNLFGLSENFDFLKKLFDKKKLPKVLMFSGPKGNGKSTLINHLMFLIFDHKNYNEKIYELNPDSVFLNQFINNFFSNIISISGHAFKNVKIEDIRNLKAKIFQSSISDKPRFIIFDDVELLNNNSLNALLKIIEEPSKNNYFILINNKSKPLIETIKSRCLEIKIILNEMQRLNIINFLIKKFDIDILIDPKSSNLTPGNFIKFNYIFKENQISPNEDFLKNLAILLNLYKKDKDKMFIDIILFLTDNYFNNLKEKKSFKTIKIIEYRKFVLKNINNFLIYNLNQNTLLNNISNKINVK